MYFITFRNVKRLLQQENGQKLPRFGQQLLENVFTCHSIASGYSERV
jgi:hypothetical protein